VFKATKLEGAQRVHISAKYTIMLPCTYTSTLYTFTYAPP